MATTLVWQSRYEAHGMKGWKNVVGNDLPCLHLNVLLKANEVVCLACSSLNACSITWFVFIKYSLQLIMSFWILLSNTAHPPSSSAFTMKPLTLEYNLGLGYTIGMPKLSCESNLQ